MEGKFYASLATVQVVGRMLGPQASLSRVLLKIRLLERSINLGVSSCSQVQE